MGLFGRTYPAGGEIEHGIERTATILSIPTPKTNARKYLMPVTVSVNAPGIASFMQEVGASISADRFPEPGTEVPVTVDPTDPSKLQVHWDRVPTIAERAQIMHGQLTTHPLAQDGVAGAPTAAAGLSGFAPDQSAADPVARLEKLNELRSVGVVTQSSSKG